MSLDKPWHDTDTEERLLPLFSRDVAHPPAPTMRWCDVTSELLDFALVTYAVEPDALARQLPDGFEPDTFVVGGRNMSLVSAVLFRDRNFHFKFAPFAKASMDEIDYRAYVKYQGERCVWFFGTTLSRPWVYWPRIAWQLPWYPAEYKFQTSYVGDRCTRYQMRSKSEWGSAELELFGTGKAAGTLEGFANEEQTARVLTHPLTGYYHRRDGRLGSYSVWHEKLSLERARVSEARFQVFEDLDLVAPGAEPHSALVQRHTEFLVFLPPKLASEVDLGKL
ncbi:MAG: DUF2071 domain-containing protein [Myxococcaceae bacterium]